ncbi:MAG: hypothetical protein GY696_36625 [Gammaproteobacteria bacterium]|nr:hypothetical protein [Gammaproteobacteria bacterium]
MLQWRPPVLAEHILGAYKKSKNLLTEPIPRFLFYVKFFELEDTVKDRHLPMADYRLLPDTIPLDRTLSYMGPLTAKLSAGKFGLRTNRITLTVTEKEYGEKQYIAKKRVGSATLVYSPLICSPLRI